LTLDAYNYVFNEVDPPLPRMYFKARSAVSVGPTA